MDCKTVQNKIELYFDDEVTLSDRREFESHLEKCPECLAALESLKSIGSALKKHAIHNAPPELQANVRNALKDIAGEDDNFTKWAPWLSFSGGGFALAAAIVWGTLTFNLNSNLATGITNEIMHAHIRSLQVDHAVDVSSSDKHTVKPWFNGKLDFSPLLKDLSGEGFLLKGGRLEYINNKTGSALVYKRREHLINVFTVISNSRSAPRQYSQIQGYNFVHWSDSGLDYWVVSDLNTKELRLFTDLYSSTISNTDL